MKRTARGIVLILVLALVTVLSVQARLVWAEDKPVKLKVGNVFPPPETSLMSEILKSWEDEVTKRTKGLVKNSALKGGAFNRFQTN